MENIKHGQLCIILFNITLISPPELKHENLPDDVLLIPAASTLKRQRFPFPRTTAISGTFLFHSTIEVKRKMYLISLSNEPAYNLSLMSYA